MKILNKIRDNQELVLLGMVVIGFFVMVGAVVESYLGSHMPNLPEIAYAAFLRYRMQAFIVSASIVFVTSSFAVMISLSRVIVAEKVSRSDHEAAMDYLMRQRENIAERGKGLAGR